MDCSLETFMKELLGKYGFTMADWIYLQNAYELEKKIKLSMDERNLEENKENEDE